MIDDPDDIDETERSLLDELRSTLGTDPLPPGLIARAESLVTWFDVDEDLVALLREDAEEPAGVRGGALRGLGFVTTDEAFEIDVEINRSTTNTVVGHLTIGSATTAVLLDSAGVGLAVSDIDVLGRFELSTETTGPCRIRLHTADGENAVTTDWFTL